MVKSVFAFTILVGCRDTSVIRSFSVAELSVGFEQQYCLDCDVDKRSFTALLRLMTFFLSKAAEKRLLPLFLKAPVRPDVKSQWRTDRLSGGFSVCQRHGSIPDDSVFEFHPKKYF